jgi:polyribonucleotide nucleotidyltransferase
VNNAATDIMQIRDETQTKIDLPAEGEKSDVITITGKKENVQEARERIQKIQNELVSNVSKYLKAGTYHIYLHNLCTF